MTGQDGAATHEERRVPDTFPGMDPYIEARPFNWPNFQLPFIVACAKLLNRVLPRRYAADITVRPLVEDFDGTPSNRYDLRPGWERGVVRSDDGRYWKVPQFVVPYEGPTAKFIKVINWDVRRTATEIHLLTANDKRPGEDRSGYLARRRDRLHHDVNLVEIDLLLVGERLPLLAPSPPGDYRAMITRAADRSTCDVFSWSVRDALPTVSVPLADEVPEVPLDLSACITGLYVEGYCRRWLRYDQPPPAGLSDADQAWVAERVAAELR